MALGPGAANTGRMARRGSATAQAGASTELVHGGPKCFDRTTAGSGLVPAAMPVSSGRRLRLPAARPAGIAVAAAGAGRVPLSTRSARLSEPWAAARRMRCP